MDAMKLTKDAFRASARRRVTNGRRSVIIFFNIINFRLFNRKYTYAAGDKVLDLLNQIIVSKFKDCEVCHDTGDHFFVFYQGTDEEKYVTEVLRSFDDLTESKTLTLKAGIVTVTENETDIGSIMDNAIEAVESIRDSGRRHIQYYDTNLEKKRAERDYIVEHFDDAIDKGYIQVYYQPVTRTLSGQVCGMEALARWVDPEYGILSPGFFVPVLEKNNLIHRLDMEMIHKVCDDYVYFIESHLPTVPVSVNLSRVDFIMTDIVAYIDEIVEMHAMPRDMINIEITESMIVDDEQFMRTQIDRLHESGYQVWMDDFGSGYSSFNVLKDFDFDEIKLDMLFLSDFNDRTKAIITSIINMAKQLGIQTLMEGVETQEHYDFLARIGCEKIQGYYVSPPRPYEQLKKNLTDNNIFFEPLYKRFHYDTVGRINMITYAPTEFSAGGNEHSMPLIVVSWENRHLKVLSVNNQVFNELAGFGHDGVEALERAANDRANPLWRKYQTFFAQAAREGTVTERDFIINGSYVLAKIRLISRFEKEYVFIMTFTNLSANPAYNKTIGYNATLRSLYGLYDTIYMMDTKNDRIDVIFSSRMVHGDYRGNVLSRRLRYFESAEVYPEDQERFEMFMNFDTMRERLGEAGQMFLVDYFRLRSASGGYSWKLIMLINDPSSEGNYLMCIRTTNPRRAGSFVQYYDVRSFFDPDLTVDPLTLWKNLVGSGDIGLFWKDKDRRFLGANKKFLDYYNITNLDDLIGKTDEDMGWHVNPEPFKRDEERIIQNGEYTSRVRGKCLCNGSQRDIEASKIPVYKEGEIVGLLGYFNDVTDENDEKHSVYLERLTGLYNARGLIVMMVDYREAYERDNLDFAYMSLNIYHYQDMLESYGKENGDRIIQKTAQAIQQAVGVRGVAAHTVRDEFTVLCQLEAPDTISAIRRDIISAISRIKDINGIPVTIYVHIGEALYSEVETGNLNDMRELSIVRRMNEESAHEARLNRLEYSEHIITLIDEDKKAELTDYAKMFDFVRVIDAHHHSSARVEADGTITPYRHKCVDFLEGHLHCEECPSLKALHDRGAHSRFVDTEGGRYFFFSRLMTIDGHVYVLECVKKTG